MPPCDPTPAGRVRALRVLDHEALVSALARVGKAPVEVVRAGRLFEPGQEERMLQAQPFEKTAALVERLIEYRPAVEIEQIEDDQHHRHLAPHLVRDDLAAEASLEVEEPQHASITMGKHLAVEEDGVAYARRALGQLRKRA